MSYAMHPVALATLPLTIEKINDQGDGTVTLSKPGGRVVSCQPDGSISDRDPGANGAYERCVLAGNLATFRPDGISYQYAFGKGPG